MRQQVSPEHHKISSVVQQDIIGGKDAGTVVKIKYEQQSDLNNLSSKMSVSQREAIDSGTVYDGKSDSDYRHSMVSNEHLSSVQKPTKRMIRYPTIATKTLGPNAVNIFGMSPPK